MIDGEKKIETECSKGFEVKRHPRAQDDGFSVQKRIVTMSHETFMECLLDAYHLGHHSTVESIFCDDRDWGNVEEIVQDMIADDLILEGVI